VQRTPSSDPTLSDVARQVAPHLRVVSESQPASPLRTYNIVAYTHDSEAGRRAVVAVEGIEPADEQLGTVVMGAGSESATPASDGEEGIDPEGVGRAVVPRVVAGGALGALLGALVVGLGAVLLGASGWTLVGAAVAGALLVSVVGAMWLAFAGMGGSDAYRQTFVREPASELTIVGIHTDDPDAAERARRRLSAEPELTVISVDRTGRITDAAGATFGHDTAPAEEHAMAAATPSFDAGSSPQSSAVAGDALPGEPAPTFATPASTGATLGLADFVGTVPVALTFVGTLSDREATDLVEAFNESFTEFGKRRRQLLVVTPEDPELVRQQRTQGTTVPLLADEDGTLLERYAASATFPATVLVDVAGTVTRVLEGGSPADHLAAVLAAVDADGLPPSP
jgi:peroxiredoxin